MATNKKNITPSISFSETDLTVNSTPQIAFTSLGVVGEFQKGRAFELTRVSTYDQFRANFGGLNPCKYNSENPNLKYEGAYIAKEYLQNADDLYVARILGLSGYEAGDSWSLMVGGALDETTVSTIGTATFTLECRYEKGILQTVNFNNTGLQELYDNGLISDNVFGGITISSGDTISLVNTFLGDCETFDGYSFVAECTDVVNTTICVTAVTTTSVTTTTTGVTQSCSVEFDENTLTTNSTFYINVVNPIVLNNKITNTLTTVNSGLIKIVGGTLTHDNQNSVTVSGGTIYLPNGDVYSGGLYNICDFSGNQAYYDCDTIAGSGYTLTTGQTIINIPVVTTGQTIISNYFPGDITTTYFSGVVTLMSGAPLEYYDNRVVLTLRSNAEYDANEGLNFNVEGISNITVESLDGQVIKPYDNFRLIVTTTNNVDIPYIVSLDRTKPNYIVKVLGSFVLCCPSTSPIYVDEIYQNFLDDSLANGQIYCIKQQMCYNQKLNNYKTQYRHAETPYVLSEVRGNKALRLFKFHTISDGDASNEEIKISITNIRPDARRFDVVIRAFGDTDASPRVLERFTNLTIAESDNNFIGRRIGTFDGNYPSNSNYILVELAVECIADAFPAGFEGYPIRTYGCANAPLLTYKTEYLPTDNVRNNYLGLSSVLGFDQDFFDFKGLPTYAADYWTGTTQGFHLDSDAEMLYVDGTIKTFDVGNAQFKSDAGLVGTSYQKIESRKFTFAFYGGFDGWDIFRKNRTNTNEFTANGAKGKLGLLSGNFATYILPDGENGITSDYYAYLEGIRLFENKRTSRIQLFATAGIDSSNNTSLIDQAIDMVSTRCDVFYVFNTLDVDSSNSARTPDDIASEIDGLFDTSYAATYGYWGLYSDTENNRTVYLPPTAAVMKSFAITDKKANVWNAAAGITRGETNFISIRKDLTENESDVLYEGRINPLLRDINFGNGKYIYIWGNKTLYQTDSFLQDINVRRLLIYLQQRITDIGIPLLFEPNDLVIRRRFEDLVNPILADIQSKRGLYRAKIRMNKSEAELASKTMSGVIILQPIQSVEQIEINFTLTQNQAQFDSL